MSRVCLASDTCDLYFSYIKVNLLLYTCSLDPFEDGVLLDTSPVCIHRYCRSFRDVKEGCKRQGMTTPSAREAWKRRRKKKELRSLQRSDDRKPPDVRPSYSPRRPDYAGRPPPGTPASPRDLPTRSTATGRPTETRRPTPPRPRTTERLRTTGATVTERYLRKSEDIRTSGPSRASGRLTPIGGNDVTCSSRHPSSLPRRCPPQLAFTLRQGGSGVTCSSRHPSSLPRPGPPPPALCLDRVAKV